MYSSPLIEVFNWAAKFKDPKNLVTRETVTRALQAEGLPVGEGYCRPIYELPTFQKRVAIGRNGWPFNLSDRKYESGMCLVADKLYNEELMTFDICSYDLNEEEVHLVIRALNKVLSNLHALQKK